MKTCVVTCDVCGKVIESKSDAIFTYSTIFTSFGYNEVCFACNMVMRQELERTVDKLKNTFSASTPKDSGGDTPRNVAHTMHPH